MRLEPLEIYILDCFRERQATRLPLSEIVGNSTANRYDALGSALKVLETEHGILRRGERKDIIELTPFGRQYIGLVAPC